MHGPYVPELALSIVASKVISKFTHLVAVWNVAICRQCSGNCCAAHYIYTGCASIWIPAKPVLHVDVHCYDAQAKFRSACRLAFCNMITGKV